MRSSQDQSNIIIYKAMALGVATAELQKKIGNRDYVWLLRESRESGMLTVQSLTKNKTAKAHRFCLTKDGWKDASTKELIAALKPSMIEVKISNIEEVAKQHIDSLFDVIASYGLKNENLLLPSAAMQSNQSMYSCYIVSDNDDISEDVPSVSRSNAGLFNSSSQKRKGNTDVDDKVLLALIVDPISQKIMSQPVTFSDGTMCDLSSVGPKHKEGVDFIRNRTMENVIKYINVIFSDDIAKDVKLQKLESLKNVIACPVTLENFTDPVLLSSGHTIDRVALTEMEASGRTLKCPMTQIPIAANSTIPDKTLSSFMKLWPELEREVENMIRQAPKPKN